MGLNFLFSINQSLVDTHCCTQPDLDPSAPSVNHLLQCKSPWIQTIHVHRVQPLLLTRPVEPVWTPCGCFQCHMCLCTGTWGEPLSSIALTVHDHVCCACAWHIFTFSYSSSKPQITCSPSLDVWNALDLISKLLCKPFLEAVSLLY